MSQGRQEKESAYRPLDRAADSLLWGKMKVEGKLDISGYTDKKGQKRMTFGILPDTYGLL